MAFLPLVIFVVEVVQGEVAVRHFRYTFGWVIVCVCLLTLETYG